MHLNNRNLPLIALALVCFMLTVQAQNIPPSESSPTEGWSCGRYPCGDDVAGFLQRIRVPSGFEVAHVGRYPGQVMQLAYGPDDRLYATVIEDGRQQGAVYVLDEDGTPQRFSETLLAPSGLAFDPHNGALYVSGRTTETSGGSLWRIGADGTVLTLRNDLPCCFQIVDNQPNGLAFGPDGFLYVGVASLSDFAAPPAPGIQIGTVVRDEAAILRVDVQSGADEVFANGIRNPFDLAFAPDGTLYSTDSGLTTGPGDRVLRVEAGRYYGWPFYRTRGCEACPIPPPNTERAPDWLTLPDFSLPRGLVVYDGGQFPAVMQGTLFVALWNDTEHAQRIVWLNPADPLWGTADYTPQPFVTGLLRPIDVVVAPDGALVVADYTYGHVWRVSYSGLPAPTPTPSNTPQPLISPPATSAELAPGHTPTQAVRPLGATPIGFSGFATNTPASQR